MTRTRNKFRAVKTTVDGIKFDSKGEAKRYVELKMLRDAGVIRDLELQPSFVLQEGFTDCNGKRHRAIKYVADFRYTEGQRDTVEDFKGMETAVFKLKAKLFRAKHPDLNFVITK